MKLIVSYLLRGRVGATTRQGRPSPLVMGAARGVVRARRRLVVAVVRVSSAMLRLVAEVPAALVQVAPVEVELFYHIFVMPLTPMVHLDGLLEGGAEVAIERGDVDS